MHVKNLFEKQVLDRLYEVYGPNPPVECITRVHQELKAMRNTPFFRELELIRSLRDMAAKEGVPLFMESFLGSSFIAWLAGASRINPLPPHRYCSRCHKVEFFYDAKDGWDLPMEFCCSEQMHTDGHTIPFDSIAAKMSENGFYLSFQISDDLQEKCMEIVQEFYKESGMCLVPFYTDLSEMRGLDETEIALIPETDPLPELDCNGVWQVSSHELYEKEYKTITFRSTPIMNEISHLAKQTAQRPDLNAKPNNDALMAIWDELVQEYGHNKEVFLSEGDLFFSKFLKLYSFPHGSECWGPEEIALFQKSGAYLEDLFTCREDVINEILAHSSLFYGDGRSFAYDIMENTRKGKYAHSGVPADTVRLLQNMGIADYLIAQIMKTQYLPPKDVMIELLMKRCLREDYRELVKRYPKEEA